MDKLEQILSGIKNEYRGGNPPEVRAAIAVAYHLQNKIPQQEIPTADRVLYFGELYNAALKYFAEIEKYHKKILELRKETGRAMPMIGTEGMKEEIRYLQKVKYEKSHPKKSGSSKK